VLELLVAFVTEQLYSKLLELKNCFL